MLRGLLFSAVFGACVVTVAGFFGRLWWLCELASHFRVQYFVFLTGTCFLSLGLRYWLQAAVSGFFAVVNLTLIVPLYLSGASAESDGPSIRAVLANVLVSNRAYEKFHAFLGATRPDFIVVVELTERWARELQTKQPEYRFSHAAIREDGSGIGVFSRVPFVHAETVQFGPVGVPSVVARFEFERQPLTVIGTHPVSPTGGAYSHERNAQLEAVARFVASQRSPIAIIGDLNITSWSPVFRDLLRDTGLRDSRTGYGLQPTWPVRLPVLLVPIDHCLVSTDILVRGRWIGPDIGSDHYPLVVDMAIEPAS